MTTQNILTTRQITEPKERYDYLSSKMGKSVIVFWERIFYFALELSHDDFHVSESVYGDTIWESVEVSNGAFYVIPHSIPQDSFECSWAGNYFEGELSKDAFGIVVSLYAFNALAWAFADRSEKLQEQFVTLYYALRDYALDHHPERSSIARAID
ncbi:TPA: antirestriction protein [Proteus mirabilis]|uniref:antirestriction protein n=1 Tax=Proteus mirabilis TaxID=584 RepID=UPI001B377283|nr:antirestriction protein [Proteus mirabilis]MBQ0619621.1 antirestriction protein [Proteus mirabilis]MCJ2220430.1 antirestriction protein [Proteus mirabilis]